MTNARRAGSDPMENPDDVERRTAAGEELKSKGVGSGRSGSAERCPKCNSAGRYIRTRYFESEAADVWECQSPQCKIFGLLWHVSRPYSAAETIPTLIALRDHHAEQAKLRKTGAEESRRDLDRLIADGTGPELFPGRWPETIAFNERQIAFDHEQAAEHARFATAAESARLLLQNTVSATNR